ncbi:MAG: cytochrome P450 [Pseudohongiellaceae bacterium]|nr:cytochrome P450 [Pseudohongiellaceae bacterium]
MSLMTFLKDRLQGISLDDLHEKHPLGHELDEFAKMDGTGIAHFTEELTNWAKGHPGKILSALHKLRPVITIKNISIVTSFDAVKDVLSRDQDFNVTYDDKMRAITEGAGFFLGWDDDSVKGASDRINMQLAFRRDDIDIIIKPLLKKLADKHSPALKENKDLVADFFTPIPAEFAIEYFGFSKIQPQWLHKVTAGLFDYIFIDIANTPQVTSRALEYAKELREALDNEIALGEAGGNTVLGRCLKLRDDNVPGFDDTNIRNNILGLLIGLVPTTAKSAAMAFDYATQSFEQAQATRQYFQSNDLDSAVSYTKELTRLNPINPGLFRKTSAEVELFSFGNRHVIPKGNFVLASTYTAMRDSKFITKPLTVAPGRPNSNYLTYGVGLHSCFGRYINDLHVGSLLYYAYQASPLERCEGSEGDLIFEGAFPKSLKLSQ